MGDPHSLERAGGSPTAPVPLAPPAARAGLVALIHLAARLAGGKLAGRRGFDAGAAGCRWAREAMAEKGEAEGDLEIALPGAHARLVGSRETSDRILAQEPAAAGGHPPGKLKRKAMSFLAPRALTIADGEEWRRLRPWTERALGTGGLHPHAQAFLDRVRRAFDRPVAGIADVREAMGRAMVAIVLGERGGDGSQGGADPAGDVTTLFGIVQSPLKRLLLGPFHRGRRRRLYELLGRLWDEPRDGEATLLASAHDSGAQGAPADRAVLLEQLPHWMFTFTGSGTDLLVRTLATVTARPEVHRRVLKEIAAAGPPAAARTVERLPYLNACLLETGRLFPPVTRTFHRAGAAAGGGIEPGEEIVHWFPLLQRDDALGPSVHRFRPERWLEGEPDAAARASNLFLRGPRACPGKDLILFVCRAAAARLLGELRLAGTSGSLARDPLPISFPDPDPRFTVSEETP